MNKPVAISQSHALQTHPVSFTRVLHLINGEHFSGAERVQDLLAMSLRDFNFEVGFACLKPGRFPGERQSRDNELFELGMKSRIDFKAIRKLKKLIRDHGYEVLHAHTPRSLLVGSLVARGLGRPLVYHVHSPVGRDSTRSLANRLNQWVESWSARQADHFVCVSDSIRQYMLDLGYAARRLTTVPNGVAVIPNVGQRPTPAGIWTLGTTALFRPRKGTEILLQALSILKKRGRPVRLLAVGPFETGDYELKIRSLARDLKVDDMIEWTGFTSDVNSHFQKMDVFVLPSLFGEGLPMVVLEAMAGGIPVVAANVEGIPQAIRDEVDGLIFEPGDATHLADRIGELSAGRHDWQALRTSALERQREQFSDTSMAAGVAAIYEKVIEQHTGT